MPRYGRSSRLDLGYDEGLSVDMSRILRHKGVKKGVPVGEDGFARFSDLAWALNRDNRDIWRVVDNSASKRDGQRFFTLNHAVRGLLIRATAKHSLECVNRNLVRSGAASTTGPVRIRAAGIVLSRWVLLAMILRHQTNGMCKRGRPRSLPRLLRHNVLFPLGSNRPSGGG